LNKKMLRLKVLDCSPFLPPFILETSEMGTFWINVMAKVLQKHFLRYNKDSMGCSLTAPLYRSSIIGKEGPQFILDKTPWPTGVQLPPEMCVLILVYEGSCIRAWQRDRIGRIYSNVYQEFFGKQNGTQTLQERTPPQLLPYYCAFVTFILSRKFKYCRFNKFGKCHATQRAHKSRKYFRPWVALVKQYKMAPVIAKMACKCEAPLINYFECARQARRFQTRDLGRGMLYFDNPSHSPQLGGGMT
jgi:hypothetical protein